MTERFKKLVSSIDYYDLWDTVEDKGYVAEDLANALYEENEQLKESVYSWSKSYNRVYEENEQLKTQLQNTSRQRDEFHRGARENANRIGKLEKENEQLNTQKLNIEVDRDYFRTKASSLEDGYLQLQNKEIRLKKENEQLKKENYELHKRLGDFEPFERYMKERTSKTSVNDIIGLVKTNEPTNSVELKKELYK